ncbi:ribonuclease P protein component [Helicobacter suis]|uniref:ribonuclease P protein component n=1 Tax=Helicobacter suis TaxID=104628 RepID=UPI001F082B97|nr:ribonuclease P protein component [Helicobacter suis]
MRVHSKFFTMYSLPLDGLPKFFSYPRTSLLGLSVSKKVGNAVQRNLIKRRVRSLFKNIHLEKERVIVFVAKAGIAQLKYKDLKQQVLACLYRKTKPLVMRHA